MTRRLAPALALIGVVLTTAAATVSDDFFAIKKNFEIFAKAYETLATGYADEVEPERTMRRGLDAMLGGLDPYTNFFDERTIAESQLARGGNQAAPGVEIVSRAGRLVVGMPGEDAGGYRQGLRPGDVLVTVGGRSAEAMGVADALALLRGPTNTTVEAVVEREGAAAPLRFTLVREAVSLKSVTFSGFAGADTSGGVGVIRLASFGQGCAAEVRAAAERLHATGRLTALVLDVRDNPGGLVDEAVAIVGLFVPQNTAVVTVRGRAAGSERVFRTPAAPFLPDLPVVVLTSGLSASASEIVAGALQDFDRAVVAGVPTFGKGLVQNIQPLPYRTAIKLTTGRYYLPSGRVIQRLVYVNGVPAEVPEAERRSFRTARGRTVRDGRGIEPDVRADVGGASDLEGALEREAAFVRYAAHAAATGEVRPAAPDAPLVAGLRAWLAAERFAYASPAARAADTLLARLDAGSPALDDARRLRARLAAEGDRAFDAATPALAVRVRAALLARLDPDGRGAREALAYDAVLTQALRLAADREAYARALRR